MYRRSQILYIRRHTPQILNYGIKSVGRGDVKETRRIKMGKKVGGKGVSHSWVIIPVIIGKCGKKKTSSDRDKEGECERNLPTTDSYTIMTIHSRLTPTHQR